MISNRTQAPPPAGRRTVIAWALTASLVGNLSGFADQLAALDPGTAAGSLRFDDESVAMTHSYAHLHDNAEGILNRTPELRIVLSDRAVSTTDLNGVGFLPIEERARRGEVRGLMFVLQPDTPDDVVVTRLQRAEPGVSLISQTWTVDSGSFWSRFVMGDNRVTGVLEPDANAPWSSLFPVFEGPVSFSAPLFRELEVTADLRDEAARESAPFQALKARIDAMARGDLDGVRAWATNAAVARMDQMIEESGLAQSQVVEMMKVAGVEELARLETITRAVIRETTAVLLYQSDEEGLQWQTVSMEGGAWKVGP